jgi:hypothetical protein
MAQMMKLAPLTSYEMEFIKWRIWEPLRRNPDYRTEFTRLDRDYFEDLEAGDAFCEKWNLPYPADPSLPFDELYKGMTRGKTKEEVISERKEWMEKCGLDTTKVDFDEVCRAQKGLSKEEAQRRIQGLFFDKYEPIFDHAAFVDFKEWIVRGKYLKVWIDLNSSRNRIEDALKKELDEWWSDKWPNFYGGKRKNPRKAVKVESLTGKYLEVHINLEAERTTKIEPEIKEILSQWLPKWIGKKEKISRLHGDKWNQCFQVYDLIKSGKPLPVIARDLGKRPNTLYKQYRRAWSSIYPNKTYPTRKKTSYMDNTAKLIELCRACPKLNTCRGDRDAEGNVLCKEYYEISQQEDDIGTYWDSLQNDQGKIDQRRLEQSGTFDDGTPKPY